MSEYEGTVIHRCRDRYGELVVADGALTRTLYFGKGTKQSSMFLDDPSVLAMHYMRGMMSALIFNRWPKKALFIGLGGGTAVKFLMRACPDCRIDAVEIRRQVIRLAHDYFALPRNHPGARIIHSDGGEFLLGRRHEAGYDHIFIDAFDDDGPAAAVTSRDFLLACRRALTGGGVLTFDLWTHPDSGYERYRDLIGSVFEGVLLELVQEDTEDNALVFAFKDTSALKQIGRWREVAGQLQTEFSINFKGFLDRMCRRARKRGRLRG